MAHAYTPGLQVKERTRYRTQRLLPIAGTVLKRVGEMVRAEDVVARSEQPGDVTPLNLANALGVSAGDVPKLLLKREGDAVAAGELLARTNGIFGLFKSAYASPASGTVETVSRVTGQVILRGTPIPVEVKAFASGQVADVIEREGVVIESNATFIQGIFGIGGEAFGSLRVVTAGAADVLQPELLDESCRGCIVVGGGRIPGATVRRAVELGVAAVIGGGIDDQDLREILGFDLGVAVTGTEQIGTTVIITEGFGDIAMAEGTFALLKRREGSSAAVTGATQIRAGVMRPEIVIPWPDQSMENVESSARMGGGSLEIGTPVRIIRDPHFGMLGSVVSLPPEPALLATGSKARVLEVQCRDGRRVLVPRANVEIVGA